jgi:hypothetical protein
MSTTYQITSLTTLATSTVSLDILSRSLKLNSIVSCDGQPIGLVAHWDLVFFARTWAGWAFEECGEKTPARALEALSLVDKWLQDSGSVSSEELWAAARAAARAARTSPRTGGAAKAAAWAADAAGAAAADAAEAAGAAAGAAAEAAGWAAGAAGAAAGAASFRKQGEFIIEHLKNSSQTSFPFPRT